MSSEFHAFTKVSLSSIIQESPREGQIDLNVFRFNTDRAQNLQAPLRNTVKMIFIVLPKTRKFVW